MCTCHFSHKRHDKHVMVYCQVTFFEYRSKFKLVRCYLIVTCLDRNTQFQSLNFQIFHESSHTGRDSTEIMVFQLLVFRCLVSHQSTTRQKQVWTCCIQTFVHQEVFLFPSQVSNYFLDIRVEIMADIYGSLVDCSQCFQQRSFIVE